MSRGVSSPRWGESTLADEHTNGRSMAALLRELSGESGNLVRQEVELAKAEMREKLAVLQSSMASMAIGGVLLLAALLTGLWAVNMGLTSLLAQMIDVGIAVWLSPLILTIALGAIGWGMIGKGKEAMVREGFTPRATKESLKEDTRWSQAKAREIKEEMTHDR